MQPSKACKQVMMEHIETSTVADIMLKTNPAIRNSTVALPIIPSHSCHLECYDQQ